MITQDHVTYSPPRFDPSTLRYRRPSGNKAGGDPEMFVVTPKRGFPRSAEKWWKQGGTGHIISDNVLAEIRPTARDCHAYFQDSLASLMRAVYATLSKTKNSVCFRPAMRVSKAELKKGGNLFGCSPAYRFEDGVQIQVAPNVSPMDTQYRSAGYHVHLGLSTNRKQATPNWLRGRYRKDRNNKSLTNIPTIYHILLSDEYLYPLTQLCDRILGLLGVMLESYLGWEEEARIRRQLIGYGMASEHRPQPHGYEYRVLSPWPLYHPTLVHIVHSLGRDMQVLIQQGADEGIIESVTDADVARAINECDAAMAQDLFRLVWAAVVKEKNALLKLLKAAGVEPPRLFSNGSVQSVCWFHDSEGLHEEMLGRFIGALCNGDLFRQLHHFCGGESIKTLWTYSTHTCGTQSFSRHLGMKYDKFFNEWLKGAPIKTEEPPQVKGVV